MLRRGMAGLLVVIISLLAAWPAAAAGRVELDAILLVDTSDSMTAELGALCAEIQDVVGDMERRGITVNDVVLGVAETRACADAHVVRLIPEGQTRDREDWGLAVADLAQHYAWTPGAARLIIPLSNEGPLGGDPVDGEDERAIQAAIQAAQAQGVMVSPLLGREFNPEVEPLARDLAQETGGRVFLSKRPDEDLADGLRDLIRAAADRARADWSLPETIPTPLEVALDGRVISTNLVLAFLLTLVVGVASAVLDNIIGDNRPAFEASRLGRLTAAASNLGQAAAGLLSPGEWSPGSSRPRRLLAGVQLALYLLLMAIVGMFLQPGLDLISWRGLGLGLGVLLALLVLNGIYAGAQYWLARRAGAAPEVRPEPLAPLAALGGVLLSRMAGFVPGFFYGRATRFGVPAEMSEGGLPGPRRARVVLLALGAVGAVGLSFWALTIPTSLLLDFIEGLGLSETLERILTGLVGAVQGFFLLSFFLAWQMLTFELLPLPSSGGGLLYQRRRLVWAVVAFGVLLILLHGLVNPFGTAGELLESGGLVLLLLSALLYSALAVGVWLYFALRTSGAVTADWDRGQRTTVLAISLVVLWVLGACAGLVTLVMRLLG
jgi:hypothetical protein